MRATWQPSQYSVPSAYFNAQPTCCRLPESRVPERDPRTAPREVELRSLLGELPPANLPFALLPVRLETRFTARNDAPQLLVRIYPDDIHIDTHEPALTTDETAWGRTFWLQTWRAGTLEGEPHEARRSSAWAQLAQRFGPERASWIAWTLRPENLNERPNEPIPEDADSVPAPRFPERPGRDDSWTRPPAALLLPSRWILFGYRSGICVLLEWGAPVPDRLAGGPDPHAPDPGGGEDELVVDESMRWIVDFDAAERSGMALRVPITAEDVRLGFDTLIALGVRTSADSAAEVRSFEALLTAQLYTAGLAFVPVDTPTNNTADENSGFSPRDPARVHTPPPLKPSPPPDGSDGAAAARLLGIDRELPGRLENCGAAHRREARAMIAALWPATGGYFLEQMLADTFDATAIEAARQHAIEFVRADGPLPVLRSGPQPYGILPVSSLDLWETAEAEDQFIAVLRVLRQSWRSVIPHLRRIDRTAREPASPQQILDVLSLDAASCEWSARLLFDQLTFALPELHRNAPAFPPLEQRRAALRQVLDGLGLPWKPRLLDTVPAHRTFPLPGARNTTVPAAQFIRWLRESSYEAIRDEIGLSESPPGSLLYLLLRHSVLIAYAMTALRIQLAAAAAQPADLREPTVIDVMTSPTRTLGRHPDRGLPGLGNRQLHRLTASDHEAATVLDEMRGALQHLETLPESTLEMLLASTLDLFAYRLDAWITSLATRRLEGMRQSQPQGLWLGGFGWLEQVKPGAPRETVEPPAGEQPPVTVDPQGAGFIHAPSLTQAATAAILRSGHLSLGDGANKLFNIDLSSRRVRVAESLLDGIRQGQAPGALLGYHFERGLHDRRLDQYIDVFRRIAPFGDLLKAQVASDAAEAEAARLRALPHPDLPAAEAAAANARARLAQLRSEQTGLPGRLTAAERDSERLNAELRDVNADVQRLGNLIARFQSMNPPRNTDHLEEQLIPLREKQRQVRAARDEATQRAANLRARINAIPGEITNASRDVQAAERRVGDLRHLPHPGLAAAEQAAAEAKARYQALLAEHRRRFLFPDGAGQQALESAAATHVVDGLALVTLFDARDLVFGRSGLPQPGTPDQAALTAELTAVSASLDAVRDALVAEAVFQMVQGQPARAAAASDAVSSLGTPPPELESMRTPRRGAAFTHRIIALFTTTADTGAWPASDVSPRATAEPALNEWAAQLLGDPARVVFDVRFINSSNTEVLSAREVRLSEIPIAPLDLLLLAQTTRRGSFPDVEQWIASHLALARPDDVPETAIVRLATERRPDQAPNEVSLQELLHCAYAAGRMPQSARAATDADMARPDIRVPVSANIEELRSRADQAEARLREIAAELRGALASPPHAASIAGLLNRVALFGISEAIPVAGGLNGSDLLQQAKSAERTLSRRLADLDAASTDLERLTAIFGPSFRALPRLRIAADGDLARSFAASRTLQAGDPFAAANWIARMARVRDGVDRLHDAVTSAEMLGGPAPVFQVGQIPFPESERWSALAPPPGAAPPDGALSIVAYTPRPVSAGEPFAGLWIDEWVEVLPDVNVTTGVAFQFDEPAAQAPQAILLAVPPRLGGAWDIAALESIVLEALDLAKLRAVDPEALDAHTGLGQLLPALCFALNRQNDTVSTDFTRAAGAPA
jgi:hypothetical protein